MFDVLEKRTGRIIALVSGAAGNSSTSSLVLGRYA
jgi:hypothetical protein